MPDSINRHAEERPKGRLEARKPLMQEDREMPENPRWKRRPPGSTWGDWSGR
jgi:hypothetical protein